MNGKPPSPPFSVRALVIASAVCLIVLFGGFGAWVGFASLSGAIILVGELEQAQPSRAIEHPDGGVVASIPVREGDHVQPGQVLLRLDDPDLRAELAVLSVRLLEYRARIRRLMAERDGSATLTFPADLLQSAGSDASVRETLEGQKRLFAARALAEQKEAQVLERKSARIRAQITGFEAELEALQAQRALLKSRLDGKRALERQGLALVQSVRTLEQELARVNGQAGLRRAQIQEARWHLDELDLEYKSQKMRKAQEAVAGLRDLEFRRRELLEKRSALLARRAALTLRAPITGSILGARPLTPGSFVEPGATLMQIVPTGRRFTVASRVGPAQIDNIAIGQPVDMRLATLGVGSAISLGGSIARVSPDTLRQKDGSGRFYRIMIKFDPPSAARLQARPDIVTGIPVQVFVRTASQPVWAYLLKPVFRNFSRALRES